MQSTAAKKIEKLRTATEIVPMQSTAAEIAPMQSAAAVKIEVVVPMQSAAAEKIDRRTHQPVVPSNSIHALRIETPMYTHPAPGDSICNPCATH